MIFANLQIENTFDNHFSKLNIDVSDLCQPLEKMSGELILISTPIGHLEDMTLRSIRVLEELDALACEDTRQTKKIFQRHQLTLPPLVFSYHEHNERPAGRKIIDLLEKGKRVGLCSDAGTPTISDPGYRIVVDAIHAKHVVTSLPGASAVIVALSLSGLSTSSFTFKGFPPRKQGKLTQFIEQEKESVHSLVFFESPYRVIRFLEIARELLEDRKVAVCLELTKKFERVLRGSFSEVIELLKSQTVKGEVTIVIEGKVRKKSD